MSTSQRLRDLEARCPALESELSALRCAHQQAQQDLERQRSLLRGISRLSSKAGGLVPGQGQVSRVNTSKRLQQCPPLCRPETKQNAGTLLASTWQRNAHRS